VPDVIKLLVDGQFYEGWERVRVYRSLEALAGSFALEVSDRPDMPLRRGQQIQVFVDDELLSTGFIDRMQISLGSERQTLSVSGRDLTADLVDCSALVESGELAGAGLQEIALAVCTPLGLDVEISPDVDLGEPFTTFAQQPGEGAWEMLERALRSRGVLGITTPAGVLLLCNPDTASPLARLVEGDTVKEADMQIDDSERHRSYVVLGQKRGTDDDFGDLCSTEGRAQDLGARANRTLVVLAENEADAETCTRRAEWEAATRAARALGLTVKQSDYRDTAGRVWAINRRVSVDIPSVRVAGEMLAVSVELTLENESGAETVIGLARPDAFLPQPVLERAEVDGDELELEP
jgi:prophage tail gpP-like protein